MGVREISRRILYYKRQEIQEAIVNSSFNREVGVRFGQGFGKRPDILQFPEDVMDFAKRGASSFHVSEEIWEDPMMIQTGMKKSEISENRTGWDLVLDIDCPYWVFSRITTHLFIKALKDHGVRTISCKFSGNKGFHIGVPFRAFPEMVGGIPFREWFPEGPRRIAMYLLDYIEKNLVKVGETISFDGHDFSFDEIEKITGKPRTEFTVTACSQCGTRLETIKEISNEFVCPKCEQRMFSPKKMMICRKCNVPMRRFAHTTSICPNCDSETYVQAFDPLSIVDVDTILIASRHLYRAPYSLHEKSGLASIVFPPEKILEFEKHMALPEKVMPVLKFLDDSNVIKNEGEMLVVKALDYTKKQKHQPLKKEFEIPSEAVPKEHFPPCILKMLDGLEDGRKRALFALLNFLVLNGWSYDQIGAELYDWNSKNREELREVIIKGHLRYHRMKSKKMPPPNCRRYYQDLGVCRPDPVCEKIKNPVNYTILKVGKPGKKRSRLTPEQLEMRRKYRQRLKDEAKKKSA